MWSEVAQQSIQRLRMIKFIPALTAQWTFLQDAAAESRLWEGEGLQGPARTTDLSLMTIRVKGTDFLHQTVGFQDQTRHSTKTHAH